MEMSSSFFESIGETLNDDFTTHFLEYFADENPTKTDLLAGVYRNERGEVFNLPVVRKVEKAMAADETSNHSYIDALGTKEFRSATMKLALGECDAVTENRVVQCQTLSGTGALSLALKFLYLYYPNKTVYISNPAWGMYRPILWNVGFTNIREYTYFDSITKCVDASRQLDDLKAAPEGSIVILQVCAHNPSGADCSNDEWKAIAKVAKERNLLCLFDMAYVGFVTGNPDIDAWPIRYFQGTGLEIIYCQSFSKIFGLYNERCGCLGIVCKNSYIGPNIASKLINLIRSIYLNPPNHGAKIVSTILNDQELHKEWRGQLQEMANNLKSIRQLLFKTLQEFQTPGDWSHIIKHHGMFSITGLSVEQVTSLKEKHHIYILSSGRMNICGVNRSNVERIVKAFNEVLRS